MEQEEKISTTKVHQVNEEIVIIEHDENFKIGAFGAIVSSKEFDNLEDAMLYVNEKPWELIVNIALLALKRLNEYENEQKVLAETK